ncbi:hypothetical protein [Halalkalibacterium halodurans]|uniref:Uncharacterized protein n=1 Tax=Halalkalibacterium halodurans TaxID=86665 RepID=A0A0M0KMI4_ALKHA|nr:hypothetical protein [Halalkalibacterium halodurans]TPE67956.1 hypothetical protein AMD02_015865 [Halalkalibacterium halodurans]
MENYEYILTTQSVQNEDGSFFNPHELISVPEDKAKELAKTGQAIRIDTRVMDELQRKVRRAIKQAKKSIREMRESDNPYYHDPAVLDYEIKRVEDALDREVNEINEQWKRERQQMIDEATDIAANYTVRVSSSDRDKAEVIVSDFLFGSETGNKADALSDFQARLASASPSVLQAIKARYADIKRTLDTHFNTLDAVVTMSAINRQPKEKLVKIAVEQLPVNVDHDYFVYKTIKQSRDRFAWQALDSVESAGSLDAQFRALDRMGK